jgi:hypothetical protein
MSKSDPIPLSRLHARREFAIRRPVRDGLDFRIDEGDAPVSSIPCVSVAMAAFNGERFLAEQLESLVRQIRPPDELVVSDDRSHDETARIVCGFAGYAPFHVRLLRNERNLGVHKNFGKAFAACRGDIIFPSDQDDVWLPEKIDRMTRALMRYPRAGVVISNSEIVDERLRRVRKSLYQRRYPASELLLPGGVPAVRFALGRGISGHTIAFRSMPSLRGLADGASDAVGYDNAYVTVIASLFDVAVLPHRLTKYRRHGEQATTVIDQAPTALERLRNALGSYDRHAERNAAFAGAMRLVSDELTRIGAGPEVIGFLRGKGIWRRSTPRSPICGAGGFSPSSATCSAADITGLRMASPRQHGIF